MTPSPPKDRAGRLIGQPKGYAAFVPKPLPPDPPLVLEPELLNLLEGAVAELGRLDGVARVIPDPDSFVSMYVRREAVLSSQIEGTQSTLEDLLELELEAERHDRFSDAYEIANYVRAMNFGLSRIETLPLSLRLIREIHRELLRDGRGSTATPGEFRRSQNWIGPQGASLKQATFVPPPVPEMKEALHDFEDFLHAQGGYPTLIEVGLAHAQFETIHPFVDGNGRVGRLLNTFLLVHRGILRQPLLCLSYYFKLHRTEYYDRLMAVRLEGDWEGWIRFFLRGVIQTAQEATETAEKLFELRELHRKTILDNLGQNGLLLLSHLFQRPLVNINLVASMLGSTFPTASRLVGGFEDLGLLREITGQKRSRVYRYEPYLALFADTIGGDEEPETEPDLTGPQAEEVRA
ncbi:MAG TPA: Fic family protein [Solirubrobacterales bacterium]|nr:Fic family protein [Solirubrobacterales bacterium]